MGQHCSIARAGISLDLRLLWYSMDVRHGREGLCWRKFLIATVVLLASFDYFRVLHSRPPFYFPQSSSPLFFCYHQYFISHPPVVSLAHPPFFFLTSRSTHSRRSLPFHSMSTSPLAIANPHLTRPPSLIFQSSLPAFSYSHYQCKLPSTIKSFEGNLGRRSSIEFPTNEKLGPEDSESLGLY